MKALNALGTVVLVLVWSGAALAQDPLKVAPANYKVLFENASVRVLRVESAPGSKTPMHQHPDTLVIPLSDSKVRFTMADGKSEEANMTKESAIYMPVHSHSGVNLGTTPVEVILVEFKTPKPGTATIPASRPGIATKVLNENPRAVTYRSTADAKFHEPAGSKHEFDQVVIALGDAKMSVALEGKPAKTSWKRGDVLFIGRGVGHESQNLSGKPLDMVIVAIK